MFGIGEAEIVAFGAEAVKVAESGPVGGVEGGVFGSDASIHCEGYERALEL